MLRIRLTRVGKKKQPHFRVVVADIEAPRDGRIVERIGYYSPLTESDLVDIDEERALYWLSVGAQPTETVRSLLRRQGTLYRLSRLHAGEEMEALIAEYKQETGQAEAQPAAAAQPVAAATAEVEEEAVAAEVEESEEEAVVEEPVTDVEEDDAEATEDADVVDEVAEMAEDAVDTATEAAADATEAAADAAEDVVDTATEAAEDALEAVEEFIGAEEEE